MMICPKRKLLHCVIFYLSISNKGGGLLVSLWDSFPYMQCTDMLIYRHHYYFQAVVEESFIRPYAVQSLVHTASYSCNTFPANPFLARYIFPFMVQLSMGNTGRKCSYRYVRHNSRCFRFCFQQSE